MSSPQLKLLSELRGRVVSGEVSPPMGSGLRVLPTPHPPSPFKEVYLVHSMGMGQRGCH